MPSLCYTVYRKQRKEDVEMTLFVVACGLIGALVLWFGYQHDYNKTNKK